MSTLISGRDERLPMNPASSSAPDGALRAGAGMRDLLHDTALLVTSLSCGGTVHDARQFSERCALLVEQLADVLARRGEPENVRREVLIAQCGLLDEVALRYLPTEARAAWERQPLQVQRFSIYDAGRRVIDSIETQLHAASPDVGLLEFYAAILGLGFIGRYAREGETKRAALIAALDTKLQTLRSSTDETFLTRATGAGLSGGIRRLAPWIIVLLAGVIAVVLWIGGNRRLDTQFAQLGQPTPARDIRP